MSGIYSRDPDDDFVDDAPGAVKPLANGAHKVALATSFHRITAQALLAMEFPPMVYVVDGILPEGMTLFGGGPKAGKSFFWIDIGLGVAQGGFALGSISCDPGNVLFLGLEDTLARLKRRIRQLEPPDGHGDLSRLEMATAVPRIGNGLIEQLEDWLRSVPTPRLIVVDVLRVVRPPATGSSVYADDVAALQPLQSLAGRWPGVAIAVLHHTRKADSDDPFERFSGSYGLSGVADHLFILDKTDTGGTLSFRSRDAEEFQRSLTRDRETAGWIIAADGTPMPAKLPRKSPRKLSDEQALALRALHLAIEQHGEHAPPGIPLPILKNGLVRLVVRLADWQRLVTATMGEGGPVADQSVKYSPRMFRKHRARLQELEYVEVWDSFAWPIPK